MAEHNPTSSRGKAVAGNVKLGFGRLIGNQQLIDEGTAEVAMAQAEAAAELASGQARGAIQERDGTITPGTGSVLQSPGLSSEGHTKIVRGTRRKQVNK
ncbi:MAG: hypothetical protein HGA45_24455 [Chloroflexales bacterium]|nr:hypothetical protein [Chloroflexales bacterium]